MNVFRAAGDLSHVLSIFILLLRLISTKQATGASTPTLAASRCGTFLPHEATHSSSSLHSIPKLCPLPCLAGCSGISLKTQELFLVVFLCRYLDLFTTLISWYNSIMKILYICSTGYIVYMIRYKVDRWAERRGREESLLAPSVVL